MAIISYKNAATRDIAEGVESKLTRRALPTHLHKAAQRALAAIDAMVATSELAAFQGWRLEKLKGSRTGQCSIRINRQYRIFFRWNGSDAAEVEIVDYH